MQYITKHEQNTDAHGKPWAEHSSQSCCIMAVKQQQQQQQQQQRLPYQGDN